MGLRHIRILGGLLPKQLKKPRESGGGDRPAFSTHSTLLPRCHPGQQRLERDRLFAAEIVNVDPVGSDRLQRERRQAAPQVPAVPGRKQGHERLGFPAPV